MDVLWFRLPRRSGDHSLTGASIRLAPGHMLILLDRAQDVDNITLLALAEPPLTKTAMGMSGNLVPPVASY